MNQRRLAGLLVAIIVLGLAVYAISEWQKLDTLFVNNLPSFTKGMKRAKSICEDRARTAIQRRRDGSITEKDLSDGRDLYADVRAIQAALVAFLKSCLARDFNDGDLKNACDTFEEMEQAVVRFDKWYAGIHNAASAESGRELLDLFRKIVEYRAARDRAALEELRAVLVECQLTEWDELAK
jgi:hypothetical protein